MWGTSSSDDKLADDLGNAIEGTRIGGRRSVFLPAGNLAPGNRGLLQQYQTIADVGREDRIFFSAAAASWGRLNCFVLRPNAMARGL